MSLPLQFFLWFLVFLVVAGVIDHLASRRNSKPLQNHYRKGVLAPPSRAAIAGEGWKADTPQQLRF